MNKFRYVTQYSNEPILINIEQITRIDEKNQMIWMSDGESLILKYADVWQLVEDLKGLEVGGEA